MKKYHVAAGDGRGYYGVNYESYREATELLKISQRHDPQAHIIEEEYHFTNADRIRAMSDEELEKFINHFNICDIRTNDECKMSYCACCEVCVMDWLQQPAEKGERVNDL